MSKMHTPVLKALVLGSDDERAVKEYQDLHTMIAVLSTYFIATKMQSESTSSNIAALLEQSGQQDSHSANRSGRLLV